MELRARLTIVWQMSKPVVNQHTHPPGGRGTQEHGTHQRSISRNMHGDEGGVQRLLLAGHAHPVDLIVDFLKEAQSVLSAATVCLYLKLNDLGRVQGLTRPQIRNQSLQNREKKIPSSRELVMLSGRRTTNDHKQSSTSLKSISWSMWKVPLPTATKFLTRILWPKAS